MFDNTKPNVIILADKTDVISLSKTLGPYKVAHALREQGYEVAVIHHLSVFTLDEIKHCLEHLISEHTLFVGVSNFFYADITEPTVKNDGGIELKNAEPGCILPHGKRYNAEIKKFIKNINPGCKLVLGGPTARDAEYNNIFDYVVVGYAECSIINLAKHLEDPFENKLLKSTRSIFGPIIVNDSKAEGYDFKNCRMRYEDHDAILDKETLILEVARGCIFRCSFCSYPMNGKKKLDYIRDRDLIREEMIDNYERFGTTRYLFSDDTVNDSVEKCKMIYDLSKTLPFKFEWWGYIRLDLLAAHPETIDYLFESGLRAAFFGIETLNAKAASAIGKGGSRDKLFDTLHRIKSKYGNTVNLHGSFIYGLPHEDEESLRETSRFLLSDDNPLDSFTIQVLNIKSETDGYDSLFISDLDRNYKQYGYSSMGRDESKIELYNSDRRQDQMAWKNQHTNRYRMLQMVEEVRKQQGPQTTVTGGGAFGISSLGVDLDAVLNQSIQSIDWYQLDCKKLGRAKEYKKLLFKKTGIPDFPEPHPECKTFSEWLKVNTFQPV